MTTSEKIARAARRILDKEGADAVSTRRVASAVGITAMALYRHYANRDALLNALADAGFADLTQRLQALKLKGTLDRRLITILDLYLDFAFESPRLYELMFLTKREGARQYPEDFRRGNSPTANVAATIIQQAMDEGLFRKDDVWEIVFETGALQQGLMMLYLGGRVSMSHQQFRTYCHRAFRRYIDGIRN
ncbi:MAG: TetR/AcrR family transcriptional regulator [Acidobacteriota bacterium]|nr:TetR/AcrR family transcriptional regulator [Acidobacteriota bacterium]